MAQFDVFENLNPQTNKQIPYLLDIQNDILSNFTTRIVVPLVLNSKGANNLNPYFTINNQKLMMSTQELASISLKSLGSKITSLKNERDIIINAIDFAITGY